MSPVNSSGSVIVVGGGVVGLACAHYLSDAGIKVTVLDRGAIGGACSLGNCGYICPSHVLPLTEPGAIRVALKSLFQPASPFRVKPTLNPSTWRWMLEFARRCNHSQMLKNAAHLNAILKSSMEEYRRIVEAGQLDCEWTPRGLLYVMHSQRAMDDFAATDRLLTEHFGVSARRLEGQDLPAFDPAIRPGLAGAFYYQDDAHLNPAALTANWAQRLRERGVQFMEQCELRGIETQNRRVARLRTSRGDLDADRVVIATGAWSPHFEKSLGCSIPVQPGKGYSVTMERSDPCPQHAILFPEHRVGVTPLRDGYRIGSMMEFVGYDESIPERRVDQLRTASHRYLLTPTSGREISRWYGWRPMTWDSLPIIGKLPRLENAYLATGHNMLGMSLATATGKLVAELITGETPHLDIEAFSPARFSSNEPKA